MHFSHQGTHRVLLGVGVEHLRLLPVVQRVVNQCSQHHVVIKVRGVRVRVEIHRVQQDAEPDHEDNYNDNDNDDNDLSAERPEMA